MTRFCGWNVEYGNSPNTPSRPTAPVEILRPASICWGSILISLVTLTAAAAGARVQEHVEPAVSQEQVFSGPQVGEPLPSFKFREVLGHDQGQELDLVSRSGDGPILLIFVHEVNRQTAGMTRVLSRYGQTRAADGLTTGVIFLDDDASAAEATVQRIRHALTADIPTGVSLDGREGPGSYGLNRNVMLTILIAKQKVVTGNFALVQPSLQADLPKILDSLVAVIGGTVPKLEDLEGMQGMRAERSAPGSPPNLRPLLAPVIQKTATDEEVDRAAAIVEEQAAQDEAIRREVGRIARTIVEAGKVENYGTSKAQEYLRKWAEQYGQAAPPDENKDNSRSNSDKSLSQHSRAPSHSPLPRIRGESHRKGAKP